MNERRATRLTPTERRQHEQQTETAVATLRGAGLTVEPIDDQSSLVAGRFEWHRATHRWSERGTTNSGYGLTRLIAAARKAASG